MNLDGILNVLDVIPIINNILGNGRANTIIENSFGSVDIQRLDNDLILSIYSETDYSGVQLTIESDDSHEITLKDNSHITLKQNYINGKNIAVAYSMFNDIFDGHKAEFLIKGASNISLDDISVIVGDIYGNEINVYYNELNDDYADNNYSFNINSVYPNPFNPATDIDFTLPSDSYIKLSVYNIKGQEVDVIFEGYQDSGNHSYTWNASDFASGIYYFHLIDGKSISTAKAMIVK